MVGLVLLLFAIGLVSTLGIYGTLGHSQHLIAGLSVVLLVLLSAASATQISPKRPWVRAVHVSINHCAACSIYLRFAHGLAGGAKIFNFEHWQERKF
jgi:hypothetical protein